MYSLTAQRNDKFSTLSISPPLPAEKLREAAPSVQFAGSEGCEWVPANVHVSEEAATISFESWAFGLRDDDRFVSYCAEVVRRLGIIDVEIKL